MALIGSHCILEMYDCPAGLLDDLDRVQAAIREAAEHSGSTLLSECSHRFEPQGVTALGLLAESHISVHTWPERGYAAADVFTCGEHTNPELACEHLARTLGAKHYAIRKVLRGADMRPRLRSVPTDAVSDRATPRESADRMARPERVIDSDEEGAPCRVLTYARSSG